MGQIKSGGKIVIILVVLVVVWFGVSKYRNSLPKPTETAVATPDTVVTDTIVGEEITSAPKNTTVTHEKTSVVEPKVVKKEVKTKATTSAKPITAKKKKASTTTSDGGAEKPNNVIPNF